jgi:hypothetical protein
MAPGASTTTRSANRFSSPRRLPRRQNQNGQEIADYAADVLTHDVKEELERCRQGSGGA